MKAPAFLFLALAAATVDAPSTAPEAPAGVGALTAEAADGTALPLALRRLSVDATVRGDAAETRVEHVFWNGSDAQLQGTFRFPLPDDATLVGLSMDVDGKMVEGELVEREKAQRVYERIVDDMRDPALLEWEGGRVFKLRVFPIEPQGEKRVVIRYVTPLRRDTRGWHYVYPIRAASDLEDFRLTLDGEVRWDATTFPSSAEIVLDLPQERWPATTLRESTDDATYTAVRVRPDWARIPPPAERVDSGRRVLVLLDDSRSALESRPLALQALAVVLESLTPRDRFQLAAADISVREQSAELVPATRDAVAEALAYARGLSPDGASDVSEALRYVGRRARALSPSERATLEVVYVGDGAPTWGETKRDALLALAREQLAGGVVFHAVGLGGGVDAPLLRGLSGVSGGRFEQPRRLADVNRLAATLPQARRARVLREARVVAPEGHVVLPDVVRTVFEDDDWQVLVRSPHGAPPDVLVLEGTTALGPYRQEIDARDAGEGGFLPVRYGTLAVAALEGAGAARDDVVRASLAYGVMSRHTAFLVLESEEAYARFQIERRRQAQEARVSGADLESLGDEAQLSPDRIQPGDPEVRIPAPSDARAVTVTFPWGASKSARYEPALGAWTVRFLIGKDTPDGAYPVLVRITHADGRVELLRLAYTVDTQAPSVVLEWRWATDRPRTYLIEARQVATETPLTRIAGGTDASPRSATIVEDARRVDVRLPDGQVLALGLRRPGLFRGYWRPRRPLTQPVTLTVVAVDRALNTRTAQVTLEPLPAMASR